MNVMIVQDRLEIQKISKHLLLISLGDNMVEILFIIIYIVI